VQLAQGSSGIDPGAGHFVSLLRLAAGRITELLPFEERCGTLIQPPFLFRPGDAMVRRLVLALCLSVVALASQPAHAGETAAEKAADTYARQEIAAAPALGNLPDYSLPPDKLAISQEKYRKLSRVEFLSEAWSVVSLLLLLGLGVVGWMNRTALRFRNRWAQGYTFLFLWLLVGSLLSLPIDVYSQSLSLHYGLSVQSWGSWLADQGKGFALGWVFGGLVLMLLFWVIRRLPRMWWFAFWVCTWPIVFAVIFAGPYINYLFNHYEPLQKSNPALVARLEEVCAKGHMDIPPDRMYLQKASEKVTTLNADVEGYGASKRVVVWDNTISKATPDEILLIFGHESGHYVLKHIETTIPFIEALLLVNLLIGYWFVNFAIRKWGSKWGIADQQSWGAFAVLMLTFTVLSFVSQPSTNSFSRAHEHAADIYGQEVIHGLVPDPQATTKNAFDLLGTLGYSEPNPSPFYIWWTYDHPATGYRAAFGKAYDPWAPGMEPKYFRKP
jgi:Zn-dependent protease with chaperone function